MTNLEAYLSEMEHIFTGSPSDMFPNRIKNYLYLWNDYLERGIATTRHVDDKENVDRSAWALAHYDQVGADATRIIVQALINADRDIPGRILDFPSGSGRVTRHLRAMFPNATIGACDLYQDHIDFCATHFNAQPLLSTENLDDLDVGQWDVIFCGSLLTHLPVHLFDAAIRFMRRSLSDTGIAIVTIEGRHSIHIQANKWKFIDDRRFAVAQEGFHRDGFGFVSYDENFMANSFANQAEYGVALTSAAWLMDRIVKLDDVCILGFTERAWDDHQDVVIFGKPHVNDG